MAPLTVLTLNCNRGCAADGSTDVAPHQHDFLVSEAREGRLDIVALQLVSQSRVLALTAALGDGWDARFAVTSDDDESLFGNALVARLPIRSHDTVELPSPSNCVAPALLCSLAIGGQPECLITVGVCHLDNKQEGVRLQQLESILKAVEQRPSPLLLGDFNALRAKDYSEADWTALCRFADSAGWEARQEACYQMLTARNYSDAWEVCGRRGSDRTTFFLPPAAMRLRIDYAFTSPAFPCRLLECEVLQQVELSNHKPLRLCIEPK